MPHFELTHFKTEIENIVVHHKIVPIALRHGEKSVSTWGDLKRSAFVALNIKDWIKLTSNPIQKFSFDIGISN